MAMKTIYICGPMTGLPENNYPAFYEAEEKLKAKYPKDVIINPARNIVVNEGRSSREIWLAYMKISIVQITACDSMAILPESLGSEGARCEITIASMLDLNIQSLEGWLK